jgi:hypothetical protein
MQSSFFLAALILILLLGVSCSKGESNAITGAAVASVGPSIDPTCLELEEKIALKEERLQKINKELSELLLQMQEALARNEQHKINALSDDLARLSKLQDVEEKNIAAVNDLLLICYE